MAAGQTDWACECRAGPVVRKGENTSLSLHISHASRDREELMAFPVIPYLHLLLHSHLDLSPTEHFLLSSWNTHAILTHQSNDEALLFHLSFSLFDLFPLDNPTLLRLTFEAWSPVSLDDPGSFTLKKHRETTWGFRLLLCECGFPWLLIYVQAKWVRCLSNVM